MVLKCTPIVRNNPGSPGRRSQRNPVPDATTLPWAAEGQPRWRQTTLAWENEAWQKGGTHARMIRGHADDAETTRRGKHGRCELDRAMFTSASTPGGNPST